MKTEVSEFLVRKATAEDIRSMCSLINEIIDIGGTTAHETPYTVSGFEKHYLNRSTLIACHVAVQESGAIAGFQSMHAKSTLPENWADIATFARAKPKIRGAGTALFAASREYAAKAGIIAINATIRSDNTAGLAYHKKMGFEPYSIEKGRPLADGTPVDRISMRMLL
ncbi:MAG: GNAT family N-acetyltransferase [Pseudomonadota bacterium]